jgi:hypothetical protein
MAFFVRDDLEDCATSDGERSWFWYRYFDGTLDHS